MSAKPDQYPSIEPGNLRNRIQIQKPVGTQDAYGQVSSDWTTLLETYASINAITGKQTYQDGSFTAQGTHLIRMRWKGSVNITPSMRVLHGNFAYSIQFVNNVQERNIVIELTCLAINQGTNPAAGDSAGC
jgi:SPP1 family predicted phage head-tail adaptor